MCSHLSSCEDLCTYISLKISQSFNKTLHYILLTFRLWLYKLLKKQSDKMVIKIVQKYKNSGKAVKRVKG